ncbi:MAG: response regulator [Anaerolineae bacterium]
MNSVTREEVHEALGCLYDNVRLAQTAMVAHFPEVREAESLEECGKRLRALLLYAIEVLRPSRRYAFGSLEARCYNVLSLRYVENMSIQRMAEELSLSSRQVHRDLWRAEVRLAAVLNKRAVDGNREEEPEIANQFDDELMALRSQPAQVALQEVAQAALSLLGPLAQQFEVRLVWSTANESPLYVVADRSILKQVLVQILSCAIQGAAGGSVAVSAREQPGEAVVEVRFHADPTRLLAERLVDARRIASSQEIACDLALEPPEVACITLRLRLGKPISVLVVEDNPGAIELYRRYLSSGNWQLHSISDPRFAGDIAKSLRPDIIILDIMMPKMDGWSVLESLSSIRETATVPVVVCSIVEDPQLSKALGAQAHLRKPVSQGELLSTLRRCLEPRGICR